MTSPRAWFLNLDAELELATPGRPPRLDHGPFTQALLGSLVPAGDVVARPGDRLDGHRAMAWCPTAGVRLMAEQMGARFSERTPPAEVVRRVVAREWIARERGLLLDGARFVEREEDLPDALAIASPTDRLLLRHRYGFAGKQRRICARGAPDAADRAFLRKALADGGVLVEPLVHVVRDLAIHGFVGRDVVVGRPTEAVVNAGGVWTASRLATDLEDGHEAALIREAEGCGDALSRAGYVGPFGVDAFVHLDERGRRLVPRCELNARYTMGWATGMGALRPDLSQES